MKKLFVLLFAYLYYSTYLPGGNKLILDSMINNTPLFQSHILTPCCRSYILILLNDRPLPTSEFFLTFVPLNFKLQK